MVPRRLPLLCALAMWPLACARPEDPAPPRPPSISEMSSPEMRGAPEPHDMRTDAAPTISDLGASSPADLVTSVDLGAADQGRPDQAPAQADQGSPPPPPEPAYDTDFEGFGAGAGAGLAPGAAQIVVTSMADDGPGTLREALRQASGPTHITFAQSGTIALQSYLIVPSQVALDGRGADVALTGCGLNLDGVEDVVVLDLAFRNIGAAWCDDAIQIEGGSRDVAISHCLFDNGDMEFVEDIPDEQISIVFGSRDITIEWSRFLNHDKVLLIGNGDAPPELDAQIRVTLHHNLFENTGRRHPFLRHGRVDMYNNWIRRWRTYLGLPYGARAQQDGQILLEANYFEQDSSALFAGAITLEGGRLRAVDNVRSESWIRIRDSRPESVFTRPYPAQVDDVDQEAWRQMMRAHTGDTWP